MPKFSIIIPVYNVEEYVKKCLDSVFSQSFNDFEVIVVNDGSTDNSLEIVKDYNVKILNQKNKGLSEARNNGLKMATGEYILFLDSDDYICKDLLKNLNDSVDNYPDLVRFQALDIINKEVKEYHEECFYGKNGFDAFRKIVNYHYVEPAWLYAIKRDYYLDNKFSFMKGIYHEDFGLIPLVIVKSSVVNCIDYCGYCYVKREGSIMSQSNYEKEKQKVEDAIAGYKNMMKEIKKIDCDCSYLKSFISNSTIMKICSLKNNDYKYYLKIIKDEKMVDNILSDTLFRKLKKRFLKISPRMYYKLLGKKR